MASVSTGKLLWTLSALQRLAIGKNVQPISGLLQQRNYAARKGTRDRKAKLKKAVAKKIGFTPPGHKNILTKVKFVDPQLNEVNKSDVLDDVWIGKYHKWRIYGFEEAVQCFRETHHPTMMNTPNALLHLIIEFSMQGEKKTKMMDAVTRMAHIPYPYETFEKRSLLALCSTPELQQTARDAGATLVVGPVEVRNIRLGEIPLSDYEFVIAEPCMMSDAVSIKGLLKRKFPTAKAGTLGTDVKFMVERFMNGVKYTIKPSEYKPDYAVTDVKIGHIADDVKHLEENMVSIINDMNILRPKRTGPFILRMRLKSPPSKELFKLDHTVYVPEEAVTPEDSDDEEDEDVRATS